MTAIDPGLSAVLLGFVLGLQHATDLDHLVAVATIVTRERRFRAGALVGLVWGLGHTATLVTAGGLVVALGLRLAAAAPVLELAVGAVLVGLGALRLRDVARDLR
ncbi:MAG TPA: high-affinity nickel-transport family protein, partial [Methylomirabilota bacterium]|nr:high-affinity nickel-transport family protein [Methylomirabilota bacterium]